MIFSGANLQFCSSVFNSFRNCLTELREQADSDDGFIGRTFEQLRELYSEDYPEYCEAEDLEFEAPVKGHGLTEDDEKAKRIQVLKDFFAGKNQNLNGMMNIYNFYK